MSPLPIALYIWFHWLLAASLQLVLLAAVVVPLYFAVRKRSAQLAYGLLLLVLAKAFLWPGLSAPWGVGSVVVAPLAQDAEAFMLLFADPFLPWRGIGLERGVLPDPIAPLFTAAGVTHALASAIVLIFFAAWAIGVGVLSLNLLAQQLQLGLALRGGLPLNRGHIHQRYQHLAARAGIAKPPRLLLMPEIESPFLCGLLRPTIVLPAELPGDLGPAELDAVLMHELTHYARHDVALCWLQSLIVTTFWFHPVVWWASEQLHEERELLVDAKVARLLGDPLPCGRALLATAEAQLAELPAPLRAAATPHPLERRVQCLLAPQPSLRWRAAAAAAALLLALLLIPMGVPAENQRPPSPPSHSEK